MPRLGTVKIVGCLELAHGVALAQVHVDFYLDSAHGMHSYSVRLR